MSNLPTNPLSPEKQQKNMEQMYRLCGKQVQSYHRHHHLGNHSSVPVELAQELVASIEYTINQVGGFCAAANLEEALLLGQEVLRTKVEKAKSMLELVMATVPVWQTECRWDAMNSLRRYLAHYDYLHLAHAEPEDLFYPVLLRVPNGVQGIDLSLFYVNVLWQENQIMAGFEDTALEQLWGSLPTDTLNQCEQVVLNGTGKAILYDRSDNLVFTEAEREGLHKILSARPAKETIYDAALRLCNWLDLPENAAAYLLSAMEQTLPRMEAALRSNNLSAIFL